MKNSPTKLLFLILYLKIETINLKRKKKNFNKRSPESVRNTINSGLKSNLILRNLLLKGSISQETRLVLVKNAIYFNGLWKLPFKERVNKQGKKHFFVI